MRIRGALRAAWIAGATAATNNRERWAHPMRARLRQCWFEGFDYVYDKRLKLSL